MNILLLEDEPAHAEAIRRALEASDLKAVVHVAGTLREYREAIAARPPDIALLDLVLPDGRALEVLTSLTDACPFPILIWTSYGNEQTAVEAMKAGALDYIVKSPEAFATMPHAVERALREWNVLQERKRAEEALRESEERFRLIFDNAIDGMVLISLENQTINSANRSMSQMLGYSLEELKKLGTADIHPKEELPYVKEQIEIQSKDGLAPARDLPMRRKDGSVFYANVRGAQIILSGKKYMMGVFRDITERKRAETERETVLLRQEGINRLQQSLLAPVPLDQKLKSITDSIVQLFDADFCRIWLIRPGDLCEQGCIHAEVREGPHVCRARDRCLHLLASSGRYTHVDGKGHGRVPFGCYKIGRLASDEDHKFLTNDVQNDPLVHNHEWARELGLVSFVGYQLRVPDGQSMGVLALFAKRPIAPAEDAMLDGLSGTVALVVQQAKGEEALRGSEAKYRVLFEGTKQGILVADAQTQRFTYANQSISRMLGYTTEELLRMGVKDIHPQESLPHVQSEFEAQIRQEKTLAAGLPCLRKDGTVFYADISSSPIHIDGRQCNLAFFTDITERKRDEERLNETLRLLRQAIASTIQVLGMAVEARDPYTAGHQQRTTILAEAIAREMGLPPEKIEGLHMAGLVHDVGKISIPAEILSKPTKLTPSEFKLVKTHAKKGYEILKSVEFPWSLAEIVHQHHERMDGSGYPRGLKGEDILMEARILAVSDTVEAMASHRPYRPAPGIKAALAEVEKYKGVSYDADVAETCLRLFREEGFRFPA